MAAALGAVALVAAACTPGDGPESIPLPTSPDTTTTTTAATVSETTTTSAPEPPAYEATIRRTTGSVPHIEGRDVDDLAFGQGYVSAQDHGCTLVDQILKIRGERSAHQGPGADGQNVESDFAWRAIDVVGVAADDFAAASQDVRSEFEAFAAGWNRRLDDGDGDLDGWCAGDDWIAPVEALDVYAYARSVALLASSANLTDFIASARPPAAPDAAPPGGAPPSDDATAEGFAALAPPVDVGSNGWAIGAERTEGGSGGMLVANPHFPWEGELRFAEVHLTVPGEIDVYGAQLVGLPGVGIGFTAGAAWTHTVSAGHRFTAYTLDLAPGSATTYLVDGEPREMTAVEHTVEILRPDGSFDREARTLHRSEYGPILDFPGVGWSSERVVTYRDANIDNDEFVELYADLLDVSSLDDVVEAHRRHQGVPLFNTIAVGADGRTWYADTSATPNLSAEAELLYIAERDSGEGLTSLAAASGVILLDGSDSRFRWEEVEGSRDPGLVAYEEFPKVERDDYVFNANDSFWVPSDEFTLSGDHSVMFGRQGIAQSMRTRQNAAVLSSTNREGLAGDDGLFSPAELRGAVLDNAASTARLLRAPVVEACRAAPIVEVPELIDDDGAVALPAQTVDLTPACDVLAGWDGRFDLDSSGATLWRETLARFDRGDLTEAGTLFSEPFDPERPTTTPAGFTADPAPVLQAMARAVQTLRAGGFDVGSTLGSAQFTSRTGDRIPIHGGTDLEGVTNVVSWSSRGTSGEEAPTRGDLVVPGGELRGDGYPINYGASFLLVVDYTAGDPSASAMLTYGQTGLRDSEGFAAPTIRFSEKEWRQVAWTPDEIAADPELDETTVVEP
ncbi:penicillin acylase family protein [Ilumatobacter sp.]|uniref:penicillin acylase family protein n=1 Tax=Ilumatobacter sp. TaxID=1967498 RepID=UPI003B51A341